MKNGHPFCKNCGQAYRIALPAPIDIVVAIINAFIKHHKNCEKTWTEPVADMNDPMTDRVVFWLKNGFRGISSETILAQFTDRTPLNGIETHSRDRWRHPLDPSDFGRCHKLLEIVPEFRKELSVMKAVSPEWSRLVDAWDELTQLYLSNDPSMSARMDELIYLEKAE